MRVLLADDQAKVRSALRLALDQDSRIHVVGEVAEADSLLASVEAKVPDLIILDWELPGARRFNLLPVLRERYPCILVVVLSSLGLRHQDALTQGADAFISKADPPERLMTIVGECLRSKDE